MKLIKKIALFEKCENEIKISEKVKEIPYFFLYFSPIKTHVFLKVSKIDDYFLESSEILENKDYVIISKEASFYSTFDGFFENLINPKELVRFLLDSYVYLLKIIDILNSRGIVYFNLNSEKVGFTQKKQPILHDFSQSFSVNENFNFLQKLLPKHDPTSFILPLEVHLLTFVNEKLRENERISQTSIENICKDFIVKNQPLRGFPDEFIKSYFSSCVLQALAFSIVNEEKDKVFEKIVKYAKTWDSYSLSALFLPMIRQIQVNKQFKPFFEGFTQLLLLNMSPDPEKRLTPKKTIKKFEDLFAIYSTF
jgi:hypothetical protein